MHTFDRELTSLGERYDSMFLSETRWSNGQSSLYYFMFLWDLLRLFMHARCCSFCVRGLWSFMGFFKVSLKNLFNILL